MSTTQEKTDQLLQVYYEQGANMSRNNRELTQAHLNSLGLNVQLRLMALSSDHTPPSTRNFRLLTIAEKFLNIGDISENLRKKL